MLTAAHCVTRTGVNTSITATIGRANLNNGEVQAFSNSIKSRISTTGTIVRRPASPASTVDARPNSGTAAW